MEYDPIKQVEDIVRQSHEVVHKQSHVVHRRYPLFSLLLITASVAAVFHSLDTLMGSSVFLEEHPLLLLLVGCLGLFLTGSLYKRLGRDKLES